MRKISTVLYRTKIGRALAVMSSRDQRLIPLVVILQIFLSVLDLFGVLIVGALGALSVSGINSGEKLSQVTSLLKFLHISEFSFRNQAIVLGLLSTSFLLGRTFASIFFTRKIIFFFSRRGASISSELVNRLLSQPLLFIQRNTSQQTLFALTRGVELLTMHVLANAVVLGSDIFLLLILTLGLFLVSPTTAIGLFLIFTSTGLILHRLMFTRAGKLGQTSSEISIKSNEQVVEVLSSYRDSIVRFRRQHYAREIAKKRLRLSEYSAELFFMPYISKYIIESTVLIGGLIIVASQFLVDNPARAAANLGIFMAAATRIAPSVLRLQQGVVQINSSFSQATPTLDLVSDLQEVILGDESNDEFNIEHEGFTSKIELDSVTFRYPGNPALAIENFSLLIKPGSLVAIVGSSGAGKTTLIDLILGILKPDKGSVKISGQPPLMATAKWPGAIGYVPQDVLIVNGTIRENIALGFPIEVATDELVSDALGIAQLVDFVKTLPNGVDTEVGERGTRLSGGERQRLGIARAAFTKPQLLILDEATSSLDGETELLISKAIELLLETTTVILIAHRLSTVRDAGTVIYLDNGRARASGSIEEVRRLVPDFDRQAKLMGL
jgi:ABC-type multidrug transport system fused ATPase/permease subunit